MNIFEGLRQNDLKYLVSNYISVDQYTAKLDDDNITVAFFCNEKEVAEDLRDFIEKIYYLEIRDIEISDSLTDDNKFILFVEFERNINFPKILMDMIDSVNKVSGNKDWKFKTFGMNDKEDLSVETLKANVRLTKYRNAVNEEETLKDIKKEKQEEKKEEKQEKKNKKLKQESYEPMIIDDMGWKRKYLPEGFITQEELDNYIAESETLNSRDSREIYLIESSYPGYEVITTDTNVFLIKGDKILMFS